MAKTVCCRNCRRQPEVLYRFDIFLRETKYKCKCAYCGRSTLEWPTEGEAKSDWNTRQEVLDWL